MKIIEFIRRERLYILLLIFVILMNILVLSYEARYRVEKKIVKITVGQTVQAKKTTDLKTEKLEKVLEEKKQLRALFTVASLIILLILCLGLMLDVILFIWKVARKSINILTYRTQTVKWNLWDVCKVAILFSFFGYMIVMIESALARTFPMVKNNDLRMIANSSILDTLAVVFIIYFTVNQYKEKLIALGVSFKNFFKNIFYGIVTYIAAVPILLTILIAVSAISDVFNYTSKEQAVVTLFMRENNVKFLVYTILFAAIIGPIIEELFFRGFMYNALKKHVGIFWSAVVTASVFASLHAHAVGFVPIMVLGLLLVYLYEKTGTLVASMTVHVMHNTSMVLLVLLIKEIKA